MRCQRCNWPMAMTRYEPGKWKCFTCSKCHHERRKTLQESGGAYGGQVVVSSKLPLQHQEKG